MTNTINKLNLQIFIHLHNPGCKCCLRCLMAITTEKSDKKSFALGKEMMVHKLLLCLISILSSPVLEAAISRPFPNSKKEREPKDSTMFSRKAAFTQSNFALMIPPSFLIEGVETSWVFPSQPLNLGRQVCYPMCMATRLQGGIASKTRRETLNSPYSQGKKGVCKQRTRMREEDSPANPRLLNLCRSSWGS